MIEKLFNAHMKSHRQSAINKTNAEWQALKNVLIVYLEAAPGAVLEADARRQDSAFDDDTLWAVIASELGLVKVQVPE